MSDEDPIVGVYSEPALRLIAPYAGKRSLVAEALADADERRAKGERVAFYRTRSGALMVGPYCEEIIRLVS